MSQEADSNNNTNNNNTNNHRSSSSSSKPNENDDDNDDNKHFNILNDWKTSLQAKLQQSLPDLKKNNPAFLQAFCCSCGTVPSAQKSLDDAQAVLTALENDPDVDHKKKNAAVIELAQQAVADATRAVQDALDACQNVAVNVLLDNPQLGLPQLLSEDYDDADLVLYTVLCHGTVPGLATWCKDNSNSGGESSDGADQLLAALQDANLMRLFLESGGARHGMYGNAVVCYHQLLPQSPSSSSSCCGTNDDYTDDDDQQSVLQRLALAVALEVGGCRYPYFDPTAHTPPLTDPVQRYVHYEQAYLLGELDPEFSHMSVWEMRHVVNSDATNEELGWGRQCLLNYRPDIALPTFAPGAQWQYCYIVRTDVPYVDVDFYKGHKSYDQILSSGGKCGPRAWYGRFICNAFGIPTWGVVQPGHAAMARWMRNDNGGGGTWVTCFSAGFPYASWEDQGGCDFLLETQARSACRKAKSDDLEYLRKVLRLEWIGQYFYNEDVSMVRMHALPDPKSPWYSLGMMQRRRLSTTTSGDGGDGACGRKQMIQNKNRNNKIAQLMALQEEINSPSFVRDVMLSRDYYRTGGDIFIPASCCSSPTQTTDKVFFLPCISGGPKQQLHVEQDAEIEYTLSLPSPSLLDGSSWSLSDTTCQRYKLSFCVCTVHRAEQPVRITISSHGNNGNNPDIEYEVQMPYTVGMWQETEPIVIHVAAAAAAGSDSSCPTKLRVIRPNQDGSRGFSFREIRLVPV